MDITDFTRTHPATYHLAVEVVQQVNEVIRTGDSAHKTAINNFLGAMYAVIGSNLNWDAVMPSFGTVLNKYSNHLVWLTRDVRADWLNTDATNRAEITLDLESIRDVATAALI